MYPRMTIAHKYSAAHDDLMHAAIFAVAGVDSYLLRDVNRRVAMIGYPGII